MGLKDDNYARAEGQGVEELPVEPKAAFDAYPEYPEYSDLEYGAAEFGTKSASPESPALVRKNVWRAVENDLSLAVRAGDEKSLARVLADAQKKGGPMPQTLARSQLAQSVFSENVNCARILAAECESISATCDIDEEVMGVPWREAGLLEHALDPGANLAVLDFVLSDPVVWDRFDDRDKIRAMSRATKNWAKGGAQLLRLFPKCEPTREEWSVIALAAVLEEDAQALSLVARHVDLAQWRAEGLDEKLDEKSRGATLLGLACVKKSVDVVRLLLADGADPNAANAQGDTPLHLAAARKDMSVFSPALPLEGVLELLAVSDTTAVNKEGQTPFHCAARGASRSHNADILRAFVSAGVNPNTVDKNGDTPLLVAIKWSADAEIVGFLARATDLSIRNADGDTAMDVAMRAQMWKEADAIAGAMSPAAAEAAILALGRQLMPNAAMRASAHREAKALRREAQAAGAASESIAKKPSSSRSRI